MQESCCLGVEAEFRTARLDTAEFGGSGPISGNWMTTYHESDPNFWGTDRTLDPTDVTPTGGMWRLDNDIFPDDLFTAGTRLDYFFTSTRCWRPTHSGSSLRYYEMEILPSSMTSQRTWNCVLYVDHYNRGAQGFIESALTGILGTGFPELRRHELGPIRRERGIEPAGVVRAPASGRLRRDADQLSVTKRSSGTAAI